MSLSAQISWYLAYSMSRIASNWQYWQTSDDGVIHSVGCTSIGHLFLCSSGTCSITATPCLYFTLLLIWHGCFSLDQLFKSKHWIYVENKNNKLFFVAVIPTEIHIPEQGKSFICHLLNHSITNWTLLKKLSKIITFLFHTIFLVPIQATSKSRLCGPRYAVPFQSMGAKFNHLCRCVTTARQSCWWDGSHHCLIDVSQSRLTTTCGPESPQSVDSCGCDRMLPPTWVDAVNDAGETRFVLLSGLPAAHQSVALMRFTEHTEAEVIEIFLSESLNSYWACSRDNVLTVHSHVVSYMWLIKFKYFFEKKFLHLFSQQYYGNWILCWKISIYVPF